MAGFEAACVSVALAPLGDGDPTIGDVTIGCVVEIKSGQAFVAERGKGLDPAPALSSNTELSRMFWAYGLRGRPVRRIAEVVGELIDASSVGGGTFDLGSATFDMTRVVTGQLDAYVEPGARLIAEIPGMREEFERVGGGVVLNNSPYDVAAAILICEEAGAVVTDAWGGPLGAYPMLGSGAEYQLSCVAAATAELHARIVTRARRGHRPPRAGPCLATGARAPLCCRNASGRRPRRPVPRRLHPPRGSWPGRGDPGTGRPARGQAGAARERHRVRRRRVGDSLHARAAHAGCRTRRAVGA